MMPAVGYWSYAPIEQLPVLDVFFSFSGLSESVYKATLPYSSPSSFSFSLHALFSHC